MYPLACRRSPNAKSRWYLSNCRSQSYECAAHRARIECRLLMTKGQHWWALCIGSVVLAYAAVSLSLRPGFTLTAIADVTQLFLFILTTVVMVLNAARGRGPIRLFWSLMAIGCSMWLLNQLGWTMYEVVLRRHLPDPFVGDIILFLHVVPMMAAIARGNYHTGSLYDIGFVASICWFIWAGVLALELNPACEPAPLGERRWTTLAPRFAMLAILSLPVLGYWAWFSDSSPPRLRQFRILVTLAAMLVQGCLVFIRQYLLDRELVRLLDESRQSLENLQRVQAQLVQREKLASLGQLVAGAAHEINNPLTAILGYSDLMAANTALEPAQVSMAQKIGQQARRTRELVSGLLHFAQQSPGNKAELDMGSLLRRALQMQMLLLESKKIKLEANIAPTLPPICGSASQLFQCCLEIIGNAMDALDEVGGGVFTVSARSESDEIVIEFADSGPGIRDPKRVFDPFYTTKPVGKGTGLGLSATYGVVQDHQGQISCHNRPEGGAVFVLRFPEARSTMLSEALAAKA